jgi:hypothetical protein
MAAGVSSSTVNVRGHLFGGQFDGAGVYIGIEVMELKLELEMELGL